MAAEGNPSAPKPAPTLDGKLRPSKGLTGNIDPVDLICPDHRRPPGVCDPVNETDCSQILRFASSAAIAGDARAGDCSDLEPHIRVARNIGAVSSFTRPRTL